MKTFDTFHEAIHYAKMTGRCVGLSVIAVHDMDVEIERECGHRIEEHRKRQIAAISDLADHALVD